MSDGYTPRRGSLAEKVLAHLEEHRSPLNTEQISELFECRRTSVKNSLAAAVQAGVLLISQDGPRNVWHLPDAAPEAASPDGRLVIGTWSDGDIVVRGGQVNSDDSVTYTRAQLMQLMEHVATPYIPRPPAPWALLRAPAQDSEGASHAG